MEREKKLNENLNEKLEKETNKYSCCFSNSHFCYESESKFLRANIKDTHREKAPSNKTPALRKSTNVGIWVVGTSNQLFVRGS